MVRAWILSLVLALPVAGLAQRTPLPEGFPTDGQTKSSEFLLGIGSGVETTSTYTREDDTRQPLFTCVRECEGKKHTEHSVCDLSCDKACPATEQHGRPHVYSFPGDTTELAPEGNGAPARPHADQLNRDFTRFNFPSTWQARNALRRVELALIRTRDYFDAVFRADHWNETPCSSSTKSVNCVTYTVTVQYTLFDTNGQTVTRGPSGTLRYRVRIPVWREVTEGEKETNCKCERKQEGTLEHGYLYQPSEAYAFIEEDDKKRPLTGSDINTLVNSVTVHDMNNATLSYTANWMGEVFIPAGWEFECTMGGGQGVQLVDDLRFMAFPGNGEIRLSLAPPWVLRDEKKLRVMCTEINKPEPTADMTYRLVPPRHAPLARAAQIARVSNFRGPWDQMRLWIASDQATYKEVEDKLFPPPLESQYVTALRQLAQAGAIDPMEARYQRLMEARLVFMPVPDLAAVRWLVMMRATSDPAKLCAEVRGLAKEIAAVLEEEGGARLVGEVVGLLALEAGDEGVRTALWCVETAVPEAHRRAVVDAGSELALALERTKDADVATALLDWIEKHKPMAATAGLATINPELPTALRERALGLAKGIRPR